MDIKFEIEPIFKIEFFKIKCIDFKNKKEHIEKILKQFPEMPFPNFYSNILLRKFFKKSKNLNSRI